MVCGCDGQGTLGLCCDCAGPWDVRARQETPGTIALCPQQQTFIFLAAILYETLTENYNSHPRSAVPPRFLCVFQNNTATSVLLHYSKSHLITFLVPDKPQWEWRYFSKDWHVVFSSCSGKGLSSLRGQDGDVVSCVSCPSQEQEDIIWWDFFSRNAKLSLFLGLSGYGLLPQVLTMSKLNRVGFRRII